MSLVTIRIDAPVKQGAEIRINELVIGKASTDAKPDPSYPGYFLVDLGIDVSMLGFLIPKSGGPYSVSIADESHFVKPKDIIADLVAEEKRLNELTARLLGYEVRHELMGVSFVYAPENKTFSLGDIRWSPTWIAPLFPVWQPTRDAGQAWLVAEKLGLSVVRIEKDSQLACYMAGKFDGEEYIDTDTGCVDGYMRHEAHAQTMPLAICRAAEKVPS